MKEICVLSPVDRSHVSLVLRLSEKEPWGGDKGKHLPRLRLTPLNAPHSTTDFIFHILYVPETVGSSKSPPDCLVPWIPRLGKKAQVLGGEGLGERGCLSS